MSRVVQTPNYRYIKVDTIDTKRENPNTYSIELTGLSIYLNTIKHCSLQNKHIVESLVCSLITIQKIQ